MFSILHGGCKDNDDDDDDAELYIMWLIQLKSSANRFVRIFNADQGRKVTVSEITDLDVILTAIEEEALEYRLEKCL